MRKRELAEFQARLAEARELLRTLANSRHTDQPWFESSRTAIQQSLELLRRVDPDGACIGAAYERKPSAHDVVNASVAADGNGTAPALRDHTETRDRDGHDGEHPKSAEANGAANRDGQEPADHSHVHSQQPHDISLSEAHGVARHESAHTRVAARR